VKAAVWLLLLTFPATASPADVPPARKAVDAIQHLRAIPLDDPDTGAGPPAKVPMLLRTLNAELKALIVEDLSRADEPRVAQ